MYMEELSNTNCLNIKQFGISVPVVTVGQFNFRKNDFLSFLYLSVFITALLLIIYNIYNNNNKRDKCITPKIIVLTVLTGTPYPRKTTSLQGLLYPRVTLHIPQQ